MINIDINSFFAALDGLFSSGDTSNVDCFLNRSLLQAEEEKDQGAVIAILNEMAGYYRSISDFPKAMGASEAAVKKLESIGKAGTVNYATTLLNMAGIYRASGNDSKAMTLYHRILGIYTAQLAADDYRLASLYNNMSAVYESCEDYAAAQSYLLKSLAIVEQSDSFASEQGVARTNLGLVLMKQGNLEAAGRYIARAVESFTSGAESDPHAAAAIAAQAQLYYIQGKYQEGLNANEKALKLIKGFFGENMDYAAVCENCADCCDKLDMPESAAQYRQTSRDIIAAKTLIRRYTDERS